MTDLLLVLDFGGTKHTAAVIARGERDWRAHRRVFSPTGADVRYDIETMQSLARELLAGERPAAIGVSFGGPVDATTGTVRLSHHVPGWENVPLRAMLEAELRCAGQRGQRRQRRRAGRAPLRRGPGRARTCCTSPSAPASAAAGF